MDIKQVYKAIGAQMLSDFESFHPQIKHLGERGSEREASLKAFLQLYLPTRYSLSSGEVVDSGLRVSHQCDLIIYDSTKCPVLLAGKDSRIFPAEPVLGVVEVKSVLSRNELKDAADKIRVVKNLERENGKIAGIIFAYKSAWKNNPIVHTVKCLQEIYGLVAPHEYIDLICILDSGVIDLYPYDEDYKDKQMTAYFDLEVPVLLWFFIRMLDLLDKKPSNSPELERYLGKPPLSIGSAKFYHPTREQ